MEVFLRFVLWVVGGAAVATGLLGGVVKILIDVQGRVKS
jgi:hypothetical protein